MGRLRLLQPDTWKTSRVVMIKPRYSCPFPYIIPSQWMTNAALYSRTWSDANSQKGNLNKRRCTQAPLVQLFCGASGLVSQGAGPTHILLLQGTDARKFCEDTNLVTNVWIFCCFIVVGVMWIPVIPLAQQRGKASYANWAIVVVAVIIPWEGRET